MIPVDSCLCIDDNFSMLTEITPTANDDLRAVNEAFLAGRPVDPEVARRVRERGAEIRQRMLAEQGLLDIGVSLLRQAREAGH
ncbi:MAG: hypothetical protein JSS02_27325 [Planctomycetes bacterium]|nr:hypothetical protein [Planctomycetota bacterium]